MDVAPLGRWTTPLLHFRSSKAWITFVIAFSVYTDQFLYASIVPVTPFALAERGHIPAARIQFWTAILLAAFGAGIFVSSPPWAWYTDHSKNRRVPFLLGLMALFGATILLWFAANMATQVIGRVLQGVAGTVVWTTGLAILVETVSAEHVGEASGYVGIALNAGSVTAPLLGGVVFERHGYNAVFGLILSVIGLDILFRLIMVEREPDERDFSPSHDTILDAEAPLEKSKGDPDAHTIEVNQACNTTLPGHSSTSVHPGFPAMIRLLFSVRFLVALWGVFTLAAVYSGFETVLPITVHQLFDWNAEGSGLIFLPLALPSLAGPLLGKLTDKYGGRWFVTGSFLVLCPALVSLRFVTHDSMSQKVVLCFLLFVVGCCLAVILEPLFGEVAHRSDELAEQERAAGFVSAGRRRGYYGQAYGYFNMAWALGNTVGPILCGFIAEEQGWATATMALGVLSGVTAIPVVLCCDGWVLSRISKGAAPVAMKRGGGAHHSRRQKN